MSGVKIPISPMQRAANELAERKKTALAQFTAVKRENTFKYGLPSEATDRRGICYDDSYSMKGKKTEDAKASTIEFLKNCTPNDTACAIFMMNDLQVGDTEHNHSSLATLTTNLPELARDLEDAKIAFGGTPLFTTLNRIMDNEQINGIIAFSDGEATDNHFVTDEWIEGTTVKTFEIDKTIKRAKERKIAIDTMLIANPSMANETRSQYETRIKKTQAYKDMARLAEETGGVCMIFEEGKDNFKKGMKYLTKGQRLRLVADTSLRQQVESGQL